MIISRAKLCMFFKVNVTIVFIHATYNLYINLSEPQVVCPFVLVSVSVSGRCSLGVDISSMRRFARPSVRLI